jgi:hypothetical protein
LSKQVQNEMRVFVTLLNEELAGKLGEKSARERVKTETPRLNTILDELGIGAPAFGFKHDYSNTRGIMNFRPVWSPEQKSQIARDLISAAPERDRDRVAAVVRRQGISTDAPATPPAPLASELAASALPY